MFSLSSREASVIEEWCAGTSLDSLAEEFPKEVDEIEKLRNAGLFCNQYPTGLAFGVDWEAIYDQILHNRKMTILEITQSCNLRCKYCTFGGGFADHRTHNANTTTRL